MRTLTGKNVMLLVCLCTALTLKGIAQSPAANDSLQTAITTIDSLAESTKEDVRVLIDSVAALNPLKGFNKVSRHKENIVALHEEIKPDSIQWIHFGKSSLELSQHFSRRAGTYPYDAPAVFTRVHLNSKATLASVPILINGFWTTEQRNRQLPMNYFTVQADRQALTRDVENKIDRKIRALKEKTSPDKIAELEKLDKLFNRKKASINNPGALKEIFRSMKDSIGFRDSLNTLREKIHTEISRLEQQHQLTDSLSAGIIQNRLDSLRNMKSHLQRVHEKIDERKTELRKYLQEYKWDTDSLEKLVRWRDSLELHNPDLFSRYDSLIKLNEMRHHPGAKDLNWLKEAQIITTKDKILQHLKKIQLGTSFPDYSEFTLRGLPVQGLNLAWQTGQWACEITSSVKLPFAQPRMSNRKITALRIGKGEDEGTHAHLIFLKGSNEPGLFQPDSIISGIGDTLINRSPGQNLVAGVETQWRISKAFTANFSGARSLMGPLHRDLSTTMFFSQSRVDSVISGTAWSFSLQGQLSRLITAQVGYKKIDPSFSSIGSPFLRKDIMGYEMKLDIQLMKGKLLLSPFAGRYRDNVENMRPDTVALHDYGVGIRYTANRFFLNLNIFRTAIHGNATEGTTDRYRHNITNGNIISGYTYTIGTAQCMSQLNGNLSTYLNRTRNLSFVQSVVFPNSLSIQSTVSYLDSYPGSIQPVRQGAFSFTPAERNIPEEQWLLLQSGISYTVLGKWQNSVNYTRGIGSGGSYRKGVRLQSAIRVWQQLNLSFSLEHSDIASDEINFRELAGAISLRYDFY